MKTSWLEQASIKAKIELYAWMHKKSLKEAGIKAVEKWFVEPEEELAKLQVWQRTSTTKYAEHVSPTDAAILPKSLIYDYALPRVEDWQKIIKAIAKGRNPHVKSLLRDVAFQHHQSTNGRWSDALGRFERWGVRSVEEWRSCNLPKISERTFRRNKKEMEALGLIEAKVCLWQGKKYLWIKPTEELSRIQFEPGYWEKVKGKYVLAPKPKKTRGISEAVKKIEAEHAVLYKKAIASEFASIPKGWRYQDGNKQAWEVWETLTKSVKLAPNYTKRPYAPKGSHRYKRLYAALNLGV
jgi:hypothetical protein